MKNPLFWKGWKINCKKIFTNKYFYETSDNADDTLELLEDLAKDGCDVILIVADWILPGMPAHEFLQIVHEKTPRFC